VRRGRALQPRLLQPDGPLRLITVIDLSTMMLGVPIPAVAPARPPAAEPPVATSSVRDQTRIGTDQWPSVLRHQAGPGEV
jgi:hypothetical protein